MNTDQFKNLYRILLIQIGVSNSKAEEACRHFTFDDMRIIGEIWPEWQAIFLSEKFSLNEFECLYKFTF